MARGLSAALESNSELSHCCRESCNFTFAGREEPPRDVFPQKFLPFGWLGLSCVSGTDPLVIIEMFRGLDPFPSFQEHELRVEEVLVFFGQVACRPLKCENVNSSKHAPPLSACERHNDVQNVPVDRLWRPENAWAPFDVGATRHPFFFCFDIALSWHRSNRRRLGRMNSVSKLEFGFFAEPCAALRGFADGFSDCRGTSSFPSLFVRLWLHYSFSPAKRSRVLLHQYPGTKLTDFTRLPQSKS